MMLAPRRASSEGRIPEQTLPHALTVLNLAGWASIPWWSVTENKESVQGLHESLTGRVPQIFTGGDPFPLALPEHFQYGNSDLQLSFRCLGRQRHATKPIKSG
jgi:hypothetical protein